MTADCRERADPGGCSTGQECCQHTNYSETECILEVVHAGCRLRLSDVDNVDHNTDIAAG